MSGTVDRDTQRRFDVFLCHNSVDKPKIRIIAEQLLQYGVTPWFDEWEIRPGFSWQSILQEQITQVHSAAVFVGASGVAPWQHMTIEALLQEFVERQCPVIPAILLDATSTPQLPPFLQDLIWIDFRSKSPDPLQQLVYGITGKRFVESEQTILHVEEFEYFDAFLSYASTDAIWVEMLAHQLTEQANLHIWLDKWELVPGRSWQQTIARGMDQALSHVVCLGSQTPEGWFQRQIERALNQQVISPSIRAIPTLLPGARDVHFDNFLELNIPVDFRYMEWTHAFHLLVCGIKGTLPGRWPLKK